MCFTFRHIFFIALLVAVGNLRAERLFVALVESDSLEKTRNSVAAFCRNADIPLDTTAIEERMARIFSLPDLSLVHMNSPVRIVQSVDISRPLSSSNPAMVSILPCVGLENHTLRVLERHYAKTEERGPGRLFERAADTNLAPRLIVAPYRQKLILSASLEASEWAWSNRATLVDSPVQPSTDTFRAVVNPQRFASLATPYLKHLTPYFNAENFLHDFASLSITLNLDGKALTLVLQGTPKKESALARIASGQSTPSPASWRMIPDNTLIGCVAATEADQAWSRYKGVSGVVLCSPVATVLPDALFDGRRVLYLMPTAHRQGMCMVFVEGLKEQGLAREKIKQLHTVPRQDGIALSRTSSAASESDTEVERYALRLSKPEQAAEGNSETGLPDLLYTTLAVLLRHAVLETAVVGEHLLTVIAPQGALTNEIPRTLLYAPKPALDHWLMVNHKALEQRELSAGTHIRATNTLRHLASLIPGIRPEQIRSLPSGGDGISLGLSLAPTNEITLSIQLTSGEIAALQRINRDGRKLLQEMFIQIFAKQMLEAP